MAAAVVLSLHQMQAAGFWMRTQQHHTQKAVCQLGEWQMCANMWLNCSVL